MKPFSFEGALIGRRTLVWPEVTAASTSLWNCDAREYKCMSAAIVSMHTIAQTAQRCASRVLLMTHMIAMRILSR